MQRWMVCARTKGSIMEPGAPCVLVVSDQPSSKALHCLLVHKIKEDYGYANSEDVNVS
jgi:hypothetical protein